MKILLLLTSVFRSIGGVHTFNRALIKTTDDLAEGLGLEVTVFSLLDDEVPTPAMAIYFASGQTRYRGFKGNKAAFAAATLWTGWRADRVVFGHVNFSALACAMPKPVKSLVIHGIDFWGLLQPLRKWGFSKLAPSFWV